MKGPPPTPRQPLRTGAQSGGILRIETDRWVVAPNAPGCASGNQWYSLCVDLPPNEQPQEVLVEWLPMRADGIREYGDNHSFAEGLDRTIFWRDQDSEWARVTGVAREAEGVRFLLSPGGFGRQLAVGMPVAPRDLRRALNAAEGHDEGVVQAIGRSPMGNDLHVITIGDPQRCDGAFAIAAYQHFSEWAGVRVAGAMVEHLLSDACEHLRQRWCWLIYPCLNIDALLHGWQGDLLQTRGINMNRDWAAFEMLETRAVRDHLAASISGQAILLHGLDLHMGWHSRERCGAGLTVFTDEATPLHLVQQQQQFAELLIESADYTDFIWHAGGIERPNFAGWFTRTHGQPGQTLEISRHRWRRRTDGRWVPPSIELERALGVAIVDALDAFHSR